MGKKKSIKNTDAWINADWEYSGIISQDMMPFLSAPIVGQKRIDRLKEIIKLCPEYYPALIELGYRYIKTGKDEIGKKSIDKGLLSLKTHFYKQDLIDSYYSVCEFFEKHKF